MYASSDVRTPYCAPFTVALSIYPLKLTGFTPRVIAHQSEVDGHAASVAVWDDGGATANRSYSSLLER